MGQGMTPAQLEQQKKAKADEQARLTREQISQRAVTGQPTDPSRGDTPQARTSAALRGMGESVGVYADEFGKKARQVIQGQRDAIVSGLTTAGNTGVYDRGRDLPGAGMQTPQDTGLRGAPVYNPTGYDNADPYGVKPKKPAAGNTSTDSTPAQTSTAATAPGQDAVNNSSALRAMGMTDAQINMPAVGGGDAGRRQVVQSGANDFVNLGNYGQEGQGNIYGKSSKPGGPMDTFMGAGPNAGKFNEQGQVMQPDGSVYNPTGYNAADPYGLRSGGAGGRGVRAAQKQFPGSGGVRMKELRNINAQANSAFNNALKSGMNTKAALRIADNIREGAGVLTNQDRVDASRDTASMYTDASKYGTDMAFAGQALREQGAQSRANASAQQAANESQFELFRDQFVDPETGERDNAGFSRMVQNAGGLERFMNASPGTQQRLATRGSGLNKMLDRFNSFANKEGINYSTLGELTQGMKLAKTDTTIVDAFISGNIDWNDIWGEKVRLPDGSMYDVKDVFSDENGDPIVLSKEDWAALVDLGE